MRVGLCNVRNAHLSATSLSRVYSHHRFRHILTHMTDIQKSVDLADVAAGVPVRGRRDSARSSRPKSEVTREKLCRATARLLQQKPLLELKVSDITNASAVAPSTFYIYFADIHEAALGALETVARERPDLETRVNAITLADTRRRVRLLLNDYLAFWDDHYAILRMRNLAADEGDRRFRDVRAKMLMPMIEAIAEKITEFRGPEPSGVPALALATLLCGAMERLASIIRLNRSGPQLTRRRMIDAMVLMMSETITSSASSATE